MKLTFNFISRTVPPSRQPGSMEGPRLKRLALALPTLLLVATAASSTEPGRPRVAVLVPSIGAALERTPGDFEVVATVRRGTLVEVAGEERDWFEVRLDGGRPGWVEREAFE